MEFEPEILKNLRIWNLSQILTDFFRIFWISSYFFLVFCILPFFEFVTLQNTLGCVSRTFVWGTRPERLKGVKNEVKRPASRIQGPAIREETGLCGKFSQTALFNGLFFILEAKEHFLVFTNKTQFLVKNWNKAVGIGDLSSATHASPTFPQKKISSNWT